MRGGLRNSERSAGVEGTVDCGRVVVQAGTVDLGITWNEYSRSHELVKDLR